MGKRNVLIEGVSGSGKTSVCRELQRRGYQAFNGDRDLAYRGDPETGAPVEEPAAFPDERSRAEWISEHLCWQVDRVRALVADEGEAVTFFCGGSRNHPDFIELFDAVFVLDVDLDTLVRRLDGRPADEWGGRGRRAERELILRLHRTSADTPHGDVVDATPPLARVVDEILRRCEPIVSAATAQPVDRATAVPFVEREVSVRDATEADVPATAAIIAAEGDGTEEEWRKRFADVLADPRRLFVVAEVDGRVVGFGQARQVHRPSSAGDAGPPSGWYLSGLTVAAEHRRTGVALALTQARLERLGAVPVHYAAEPENEATIRLHERLGFEGTGTITLSGADRPLLLFRRDGGAAGRDR